MHDAPLADEERAQHYRSEGWWPGEPLEERFARHVQADPDATALVWSGGLMLTRGELWAAAGRLAETLTAGSVRRGHVVLIILPNDPSWLIAFLGAKLAGLIPATIPTTTDSGNLAYVVDQVRAQAILAAPGYAGEVDAAAEGRVPVLSITPDGTAVWATGQGEDPAAPSSLANLDHVMFTSSTTGRPKAVMHTADTLAALNVTFTQRFGLDQSQPVFMASPLGHSVGAIHGARLSLFNGSVLVLQDRWDASQALRLVAENDCTFTAAATPFLLDLLNAPPPTSGPKLSSLRWFLCGGAQVPPSLMERARVEFPDTFVTVLWGMTEGGLTTCTVDSPRDKVSATAGVALPGLELLALDQDGKPQPSGQPGELAMRGPGVFTGYLGQDDLYRSLLTPDGFFRTGDLATLDAEGYLTITGRLKDLIIRGGVNISPVPIENALAAHGHVGEVAVVGLPDERLGERICAAVIPRGVPPTLEELARFATGKGLAKRMLPEILYIVDDMPRTAAGKIRKLELRERLIGVKQGKSQVAGTSP